MSSELLFFIGFNIFVFVMLALDLGVFHRNSHVVSLREAAIWSAVWISSALAFCGLLFWWQSHEVALQFLTGYLIEYSLSVDNIFVFVMLFGYFAVPAAYQHRVLFWGILAALVMRGLAILAGAALIDRFHWILYFFGVFLIFTGVRMALDKGEAMEPESNPILRLCRRFIRVTPAYHGQRFFVRLNGQLLATPLFMVFVIVNVTDVIFAVDSIPAIFAITTDPFIVYTSNVFAILGLRSLYFLLAGVVTKFHYLNLGLGIVLSFVGAKMLLADIFHIPTFISLLVVIGVIGLAILASIVWPKVEEAEEQGDGAPDSRSEVRPSSHLS